MAGWLDDGVAPLIVLDSIVRRGDGDGLVMGRVLMAVAMMQRWRKNYLAAPAEGFEKMLRRWRLFLGGGRVDAARGD